MERFCSPDTLRRLFLRFNYRQVTEVSERLMRFSLARMRPILMGHTLDLDSTVLCRYGEQEGSIKGYNPHEAGATVASSVGGVFSRRASAVMGGFAQWE